MSLALQKSRFIPYSRNDIARLLLNEKNLRTSDRNKLKVVCDLLMHVYHFEFLSPLDSAMKVLEQACDNYFGY